MEILWVVNIPLPEASLLMHEKPLPFGGWLVNASKALSEKNNLSLSIAFPKKGIEDVQLLSGSRIKYYTFSLTKNKNYNLSVCESQLSNIIERVKPDLVHIFGTEYIHTIAMVNICKSKNIKNIISIQGLVSICAKHYMAFLPEKVQNKVTFRDIIKHDNLKQQQKTFEIKGRYEIEAIKNVKHVIGRTTWDKACTTQINPNVLYHFCNEILRDEFYKYKWSYDKCEKYSIFISQASYPIKGLHIMLEAMPLILRKFPNAKLYIAGLNMIKSDTLKDKLRRTSYDYYIKDLIKKFNLCKNILFTGLLDEKQMCSRYLSSNVFVCPSSIENSPNSLGEAMILGVPCVASDVGGIADLLKHKEEGFVYQADAPYMLAYYICEIFENKELALNYSNKSRTHAMLTYDKEINTNKLVEIYKNVVKELY